jgi:hypothetical protein
LALAALAADLPDVRVAITATIARGRHEILRRGLADDRVVSRCGGGGIGRRAGFGTS